jgi:molecular chaperone HtpG
LQISFGGHGVDDLETIHNEVVLGSQIVDPRKLAACLSLADIAHADSSRAPEIVFRHLELDEDSAYHWKRHMQISGITRKSDSILMSALTFSDEGDRAVEEYRAAIETQLSVIKPYFDTVLQPIENVELSIKRLDSPLDQTLRFQTNTPGILKVLIEGVYDREDVFVRELVQNSLDACLVRRLKLERRNEPFDPKILLTFLSSGKRVRSFRIDDNGIGMDLNDLRDTVLWIGSSISINQSFSRFR